MSYQFGDIRRVNKLDKEKKLIFLLGGTTLTLIFLLVVSLFYSPASSQNKIELSSGIQDDRNSVLADRKTIDALVTRTNVSASDRLVSDMLAKIQYQESELPINYISYSNRNSALGMYANIDIPINTPITSDHLSKLPAISSLPIPPDYRAVTVVVVVDKDSSRLEVGSYVEVNCIYKSASDLSLITLAAKAKVLALEGGASEFRQRAVTILVSSREAKEIELGKKKGAISLNLTSARDNPLSMPQTTKEKKSPIDWKDIPDGEDKVEENKCRNNIHVENKNGDMVKMCINEDGTTTIDGVID